MKPEDSFRLIEPELAEYLLILGLIVAAVVL